MKRGNKLGLFERLPIANPKDFAKWLIQTRKSLGLSQAKLSAMSRVSTRTINAIENCIWTEISLDVLLRLASGMGIAHSEITTKAGENHQKCYEEWYKCGGRTETLLNRFNPLTAKMSLLDWNRILTKEELQFLLGMCDQFDNFTLGFALTLLDLRKK